MFDNARLDVKINGFETELNQLTHKVDTHIRNRTVHASAPTSSPEQPTVTSVTPEVINRVVQLEKDMAVVKPQAKTPTLQISSEWVDSMVNSNQAFNTLKKAHNKSVRALNQLTSDFNQLEQHPTVTTFANRVTRVELEQSSLRGEITAINASRVLLQKEVSEITPNLINKTHEHLVNTYLSKAEHEVALKAVEQLYQSERDERIKLQAQVDQLSENFNRLSVTATGSNPESLLNRISTLEGSMLTMANDFVNHIQHIIPHDINFLWGYVKSLLDLSRSEWRRASHYTEPPLAETPLQLANRPRLEKFATFLHRVFSNPTVATRPAYATDLPDNDSIDSPNLTFDQAGVPPVASTPSKRTRPSSEASIDAPSNEYVTPPGSVSGVQTPTAPGSPHLSMPPSLPPIRTSAVASTSAQPDDLEPPPKATKLLRAATPHRSPSTTPRAAASPAGSILTANTPPALVAHPLVTASRASTPLLDETAQAETLLPEAGTSDEVHPTAANTRVRTPPKLPSASPHRVSPRNPERKEYNVNAASKASISGTPTFPPRILSIRAVSEPSSPQLGSPAYDWREAQYDTEEATDSCHWRHSSDSDTATPLSGVRLMTEEAHDALRALFSRQEPWPQMQETAGHPTSAHVPRSASVSPRAQLSDAQSSPRTPQHKRFPTLNKDYEQQQLTNKTTQGKKVNRSAKNRRQARDKQAAHLPSITPKLFPVIPVHLWKQFRDGEFYPTNTQIDSHDKFFDRRPTLISLQQLEDETSLHLFNGNTVVTAATVMLDTGSEVKVMIAPDVARQLKLTWTPDSTNIVGVGGSGGGDGYAHQPVVLRLGQFNGTNLDELSPMKGCFEMNVKPLVMKDQVVDDIGYEVIIGQGVLRACGGVIDPISESLIYSPAWLSHACPALRCSIPLNMSRPGKLETETREAKSNLAILKGSSEHEDLPLASMMVRRPKYMSSSSSDASDHSNSNVAAATKQFRKNKRKQFKPATSPKMPPRDTSEVKLNTHVQAALAGIKPVTVAPVAVHPGFPQKEAPTRDAHRDWSTRNAARNRLNAQAAQELRLQNQILQQESGTDHLLRPHTIGFLASDLMKLDFVTENFEIDCSRTLQHTQERDDRIVTKIMARLAPFISHLIPDNQATSPAPAAANPAAAVAPDLPFARVTADPPAPAAQTQSNNPQPLRRSQRVANNTPAAPAATDSLVQTPAAELDASETSPPPAAIRRVNTARNPYGVDNIWFSMNSQGWPTLAQSGEVASLPRRSQTGAAQAAVAKALAAVTLASVAGSASAHPISTNSDFMHDTYGQDFAAAALALGALTALYMLTRMLYWCCRNRFQSVLCHTFAATMFLLVSLFHFFPRCSTSAMWVVIRNSPYLLPVVVAIIPAMPLYAWLWNARANHHFRLVWQE